MLGYLSPITGDELAASEAGDGPVELGGTDLVGRAGLEQVYDADLRGTPGTRTVAVDARGAVSVEAAAPSRSPGTRWSRASTPGSRR